jgi:hypothetical protein
MLLSVPTLYPGIQNHARLGFHRTAFRLLTDSFHMKWHLSLSKIGMFPVGTSLSLKRKSNLAYP